MSKYAIIETGGKQYRVEEKDSIVIERVVDHAAGDQVVFDRVLMVRDGENVQIGQPFLDGAKVVGTIAEEFRGPKIKVFNYKPKKRSSRRMGHRQTYIKAQIEEITA
jgi:large subunit ribosomal protein L21